MQSACTVSRSIRASELDIQCMGGECPIIGANRAGNRARTLPNMSFPAERCGQFEPQAVFYHIEMV